MDVRLDDLFFSLMKLEIALDDLYKFNTHQLVTSTNSIHNHAKQNDLDVVHYTQYHINLKKNV